MMHCHDESGPNVQPKILLDAANIILQFAYQHSQRSVIQQLQLARNDVLVMVDTLRLWSTHPDVYTILHTHKNELVDAVSYRCTQIKKSASPRQAVEPLRVYVVPEQELAPMVASRKQLFDCIRNNYSPNATTCTIMGLVSCISAATSIPYGLCYHCSSCKLPVLICKKGNKDPVCPCGAAFGPSTPLQHMHTVYLATIHLPGVPFGEDVEVQVAAKVGNHVIVGSHYEMVVNVNAQQFRSSLGILDARFHATSIHPLSMAHLRAQQLQCPVQNAERSLQPMPLQTLLNLLRAASCLGGAHFHVTWYVALATLVSAVAIGESHRQGKVHNNGSHRCQVHLLWVGRRFSTCTRSFVSNAAKICSPVAKIATMNDHLEPRANPHADGTLRFQGGKLIEGSQGLVLVELAGMSRANLHRLHGYTRDCTSAPQNKTFVSTPPMSNTATCWAMADTQALPRHKDATDMEQLEFSTGGLAVPNFDLLLNTGNSDTVEDTAIDSVLGLVDDHVYDSTASQCLSQLRRHLLKACAMDRPCMTDECIQVLQSYYSALRASYANSGHVQHTSQTLSTLIRLCLASSRLCLRNTTDVVDCMVAIRLVEESMDVRCSGMTEKMFGADLHDLAGTADTEWPLGIDEYLRHLGQCFTGNGKGNRMDSEE